MDAEQRVSLEYQRYTGLCLNAGFKFGCDEEAIEKYAKVTIYFTKRGVSLIRNRELPNYMEREHDNDLINTLKKYFEIMRPAMRESGVDANAVGSRYKELFDLKTCCNCNIPFENLKKCMRCESVKYCTKRCQKEHWPHHRKHCDTIMSGGIYKKKNVIEMIS